MQCYDLVLDSLAVFEEKATKDATVVGQPKTGSSDDAETVRNHAFELAFASEDQMFHSTLYEWFISRSLADELLEVPEPHPSRTEVYTEVCLLVTTDIPRSSSPKRACDSPKISATLAVLREGRPTIAGCRGSQHVGGIDFVSVLFSFTCGN
jgi:nuclear pore complex protein Nup155